MSPVTLEEMPPLIVTEPLAALDIAASVMPRKEVLLDEPTVITAAVP